MKTPQLKKYAIQTLAGVFGVLLLSVGQSAAQPAYPNRPIQIIVPFAPGGSIDITFRVIAPSLSKRLGQQILVVNKAGGGATIGMNEVAKAAADGYTLGAASFAFAANKVVLESLPYDPEKDFAPITMVSRSPMLMLVHPGSPAKTVQEFIDWVKSKPGELNYGSVGVGSSGHLMTELFLKRAGLKMTHVPFTSGPLPPLSRNETQLQFGPIPSSLPWAKDGRLRAIGVTSLDADPTVPDLPPVSRTLKNFEAFEWPGLVAPAGTPRAVIDRLQQEIVAVLAEPEIRRKLADLGSQPVGGKPEEFAAFIKKEIATWAEIGRDAGLKK